MFLNEDRHPPEDIASFAPELCCSVVVHIYVRSVTWLCYLTAMRWTYSGLSS